MTAVMTTEAFETFLWDNGVGLPFPLHLGPAGPPGPRPELVRLEHVFDEEMALRRGLYPRETVAALAEFLRVMEAPEAIAIAYAYADGRDEPDCRWVTSGVVRGNDALVITEAPGEVRLQQVTWSDLAAAVAATVPPMLGLPMPKVTVRADALEPLREAVAMGASERIRERAAASAGLPPGLNARMDELKARSDRGGFVGACREVRDRRVLSPASGDFFGADDGAVLRSFDGGEVTFEPASTGALARVIGVALQRLPSAASAGL